mmetsp:Transcript_14326/g.57037  ORF Transcript_14326/g.57037 Transcript_14326/m.57037 type:complete len:250 (+) Transcript_14326:351-1100(+)
MSHARDDVVVGVQAVSATVVTLSAPSEVLTTRTAADARLSRRQASSPSTPSSTANHTTVVVVRVVFGWCGASERCWSMRRNSRAGTVKAASRSSGSLPATAWGPMTRASTGWNWRPECPVALSRWRTLSGKAAVTSAGARSESAAGGSTASTRTTDARSGSPCRKARPVGASRWFDEPWNRWFENMLGDMWSNKKTSAAKPYRMATTTARMTAQDDDEEEPRRVRCCCRGCEVVPPRAAAHSRGTKATA